MPGFDVAFLRKHGIDMPIHRVDDTMMLSHIVDPTVSVGLKQQTSKHIDPRAASAQGQLDKVMHSGNWTWGTIPIAPSGPLSVYWQYGALDCVLTAQLFAHHWPVVSSTAMRSYDLELATGWIADRMERRGVLVDREYTTKKRDEFTQMYQDMTERGRAEFGVDLGSTQQVVDALVRDNVPLWKRTPGGALSLDKFALEGITHPLAILLQERKRVEKLGSTYLRRFLEYSEANGRVHPSINTLGFSEQSASGFGVVTSRMSMSAPNLQQLPRVEENDPISAVVRNCIVSDPGETFVLFDFDQLELRVMAALSKDEGLAEAFRSEGDFFTELAKGMYNDPGIVKKDKRRQNVKSTVYGTLFGAGADKIATTAKIALREAEETLSKLFTTYPGIRGFQQGVQDEAAKRYRDEGVAYVTSPMTGRKRIASDVRKLYQLVNYQIQGLAAEIMKTKLLELDAAGLGDALALVVHDEAIACVPDEDVSDAIATMRDVMNDDTILSVPLTAGGATAKKWAQKVEI